MNLCKDCKFKSMDMDCTQPDIIATYGGVIGAVWGKVRCFDARRDGTPCPEYKPSLLTRLKAFFNAR